MVADRFQNFFYLSKLQRHLEVASAMQVPRFEHLASSIIKQSLLNPYYMPYVACQEVVHKNDMN